MLRRASRGATKSMNAAIDSSDTRGNLEIMTPPEENVTEEKIENSGFGSLEHTPSLVNLHALAADQTMLSELRARAASESDALLAADQSAPSRTSRSITGVVNIRQSSMGAGSKRLSIQSDGDKNDTSSLSGLFAVSLPLLRMGFLCMVDDSFTRCFKSQKRRPWNFNVYLFPAWVLGVIFRYTILFPLRLFALILGFVTVFTLFPIVKLLSFVIKTTKYELMLIQLLATSFVASWSGVVRIHGIRPQPRAGKPAGVFVSNHSSMIDFIILLQSHPYAVVGQHHPNWVGFLQDTILASLSCVWFNRGESKDRKVVAERLRAHAHDVKKANVPLLVFPEGTCVNNEYVVQFKKGVFELGVPINPIAIKYNKVFVDAYWNSRQQSFAQHLFSLMTSWAVVADIWFLDPQTIRKDESPVEFATRVQRMIAARAGLIPVDWDGYMKYWKPSSRFIEKQQKQVADALIETFGIVDNPTTGVELLPETRIALMELYKSRKESFKMDEKENEISTKSSSQKKVKVDESKRQILETIQSLIDLNERKSSSMGGDVENSMDETPVPSTPEERASNSSKKE
jgi:glycerol-3-phosphate O-acyltransferase 3/4